MKSLSQFIFESLTSPIADKIESEIKPEINKLGLEIRNLGGCVSIFGDAKDKLNDVVSNIETVLNGSETYKKNKDTIKIFYLKSKFSRKPIVWIGQEEPIQKMSKNIEQQGEIITWK